MNMKSGGKPPHSKGFLTGARRADLVSERRAAGGKRAKDSAHVAETDGRAIRNDLTGADGLIVHSRAILAAQVFNFGAIAENVNHCVAP